jgi:hypothetical protein
MKLRALAWLFLFGHALSQVLNVALQGGLFIVGVLPAPPDPDETFSAVVGRSAIAGQRWALAAEWGLDRLFWFVEGRRLGHCRRAAALHLALPPRIHPLS